MGDTVPSGKWPCPAKAENIKLGVLVSIMQEFNISAEEFVENQTKYIEMYEEKTGRGC